MFETDFHAHSLFSSCGLHSIIEMLTKARDSGIKAQAITDHGPYLGRKTSSTFFERLDNPVDGIILLKGIECNVVDEDGTIDVIEKFMKWYDLVLLGFHNFKAKGAEPEYYSRLMAKAITKNPCVDIIVHPNVPGYRLDFGMIADIAAESGTAIEFNNAKTRLGRSSAEETIELIETCKASGCYVAVNTDAHALNEVADHGAIEELLKDTGFPMDMVVNRTYESAMNWIESRKARRAEHY
ncbi:MAG: PHP domain-containing protein [Spirochaetales bacterium]|uniref:PHP domain-containing protein n=1 Tax=Candidatus Thalassospirochaeta sargassi TaxID=3119039 RepID=A0AAJ1IFC3_9SPIO|nr:PHP domain-containing protein [Spirochaetales bacterium]